MRRNPAVRARWVGRLGALVVAARVLVGPPAEAQPARPAPKCSVSAMLEDLRAAQRHGSPSLQRYMRELFKESSLALPFDELKQAFEVERAPVVLEVLGAALAARSMRAPNPAFLQPVLERARNDADPAVRAAAVRSLRGTGSVEAMERLRDPGYAQLMRDASPEVRAAVVDNLIHEADKVYFGRDRAVAELAVKAAASSPEPELAARLLSQVSMEPVGPAAMAQLVKLLGSEHEPVRAAAARALGGVDRPEVAGVQTALVERYRRDSSPEVRRAVLEALVHLQLEGALPVLASLRGVDPAMDGELEAWRTVLGLGLQEWDLVLREKRRLR